MIYLLCLGCILGDVPSVEGISGKDCAVKM